MEARGDSGMSGPPSRTEVCLGDRGSTIDRRQPDLTLGLGISIKPLDQWPIFAVEALLALFRQVEFFLPSPICSLLRWGPALLEWKQMF